MARAQTITGGRDATVAVIPGRHALSVGLPNLPAPDGWSWTPLSSVARLESGHTPSRRHPEYWGGSVPWIGIRDATGNHGRVIHETIEYTNELGIENSSARVLPKDTVCLSRTASVGYVVVMGRPMSTSQDFVNWICSKKLNPHFLKYILLSEREALLIFAVGSVHQTIYFPEAKAFHICMPDRRTQDSIVEVLGALDDKIELNRRMNETLEATARAIFKNWFVDFGPTRAKLEGRAAYLAPEIWSLFPDTLDEDRKPEGWVTSTIGQEVDVVGGSTPSTKEATFWSGDISWATPKDLSSLSTPVLLSTERQITGAGLSQIGSGLLPVGTVHALFSCADWLHGDCRHTGRGEPGFHRDDLQEGTFERIRLAVDASQHGNGPPKSQRLHVSGDQQSKLSADRSNCSFASAPSSLR